MSATKTTGAVSMRAATLEYNTNFTTPAWSSIAGTLVEIGISGGEHSSEDTHVAASDDPIVTYGKRSSKTVTITLVHSEEAGDGPALLKALEGTMLQFRWTVKPATTGNKRWTTEAGLLNHITDPVGAVGAAGSLKRVITHNTPKVAEAAITP